MTKNVLCEVFKGIAGDCVKRSIDFSRLFLLRTVYRIRIMDSESTIRYVRENLCSVARFGDGEFDLLLKNSDLELQANCPILSKKLGEVLITQSTNLLVCIPRSFNSLRYRNKKSTIYWQQWCLRNQKKVVQLVGSKNRILFGDSQISRPYIAFKDGRRADRIFPMLKTLWDGRDLLVVEGELTRLGIGNDLFQGSASIARILAPAKNAFDRYDEILDKVIKCYKKNNLVIIALGPTATILAAELSERGIQAIDIGHVDIEYEWYIGKAKDRMQVPGKFMSEVAGGANVNACNNPEYEMQIIDRVSDVQDHGAEIGAP